MMRIPKLLQKPVLEVDKLLVSKTIAMLSLLTISTVSQALTPNPGATCPSGYTQGTSTNADYTTLMNSYNNNNYVTLAGSGTIPLKVNMSVTESNANNQGINFGTISYGGYSAINVTRNFPNWQDNTKIKLDFQNSLTSQPMYLTNVALSTFDIDYDFQTGSMFDDSVIITGITASGSTIRGTTQPISGSNIVNDATYGLRNSARGNCTAKDLSTSCQGSVQFSEPVSSVTITYSNTDYLFKNGYTDPTNQEIDFRLDNYCYAPPSAGYSITKDDGVSSVVTGSNTTYTIKVTNTGSTTLTNIVLKDPAVTGLTKQSNITCDTSDTNNICTSSSLPTIAQLEGVGYTINSLAVGKTYTIKIPANVTASSGSSVTNTATVSATGVTSQSDSDTDKVSTIFDNGGTITPASCPSGDNMYFIGNSAPAGAYASQNLSNWVAGSLSNSYTFADGTIATISFADLIDKSTSKGNPPFYGSGTGLGNGTLNLYHNSTGNKVNHSVALSVNRPVTRAGFVINDLDSYNNEYQERFDVSGSGGVLTYDSNAQTINATNDIVTSILGRNCSYGTTAACPINATWGYANANTQFKGYHSNIIPTASNSPHADSYGNFYFCLAPPKLITKKVLNGNRAAPNDQFTIDTKNGTTSVNTFTTSGSGSTLVTGTDRSTVMNLTTSATYTITESVVNGGSISNYTPTYSCTNNSSSGTTMPSGSGSTFPLTGLKNGDEITCTITNTPAIYTFSGTVFNDYKSTNTTTNYDGLLNGGEAGIGGTTVKLTNCDTGAVLGTTTTATNGTYQFSLAPSVVSGLTKVCAVETNLATYPNDTTANTKTISLVAGNYNYPNNNFGDVQTALLKLVKSQVLVPCDENVDLSTYTYTTDALSKTADGKDIASGSCIAYKIVATNQGNVPLSDVVITDKLENNSLRQSVLYGTPMPKLCLSSTATCTTSMASDSVAVGDNGTVKTNPVTLPAGSTGTLYFKVKYNKLYT